MRVTLLAGRLMVGWLVATFSLGGVFAPCVATECVRAGEEGEPLSPSDFLLRYRLALSELEAHYRNAQIDGRHSTARYYVNLPVRNTDDGPQKSPRERGSRGFSYVFSNGNEKLRFTNAKPFSQLKDPKHYIDSVFVNAVSQQFMVSRRAPNDAYFLTRNDSGGATPNNVRRLRSQVRDCAYCPAGFSRFPEYANSPHFKVTEVTRQIDSGRPITKFVFEYRPNNLEKPNIEGWVRLEASMNWVIRDYEIVVTNTAPDHPPLVSHITGSVSYKQEQAAAIPIQVKYDEWYDNTPKMIRSFEDTLYEIDRFVLGAVPPGDFALAAFGLDDFERSSGRATYRGTHVLIICGVIALLISAVLARFARSYRRKDKDSAPASTVA